MSLHTYPTHSASQLLLRANDKRPRKTNAAKKRNELPTTHSITSSAPASRIWGPSSNGTELLGKSTPDWLSQRRLSEAKGLPRQTPLRVSARKLTGLLRCRGSQPCARSGLVQRSIKVKSSTRSAESGGMESSDAGNAADGGKGHVGHPGPKPVQVYRVQSW